MTKKERAGLVIDGLAECYPDVKCALVYKKPHELLIATRLSAQCTDKRVNMVTPALFENSPILTALRRQSLTRLRNIYIRADYIRQKLSILL